jgi:Restriction endonuclease XhoI
MDGFIPEIPAATAGVGYPEASIYTGRRVNTIPSFFRPTNDWDIVLVHDGQLLAALELKAQAGPSFGNNYNNRVEEAPETPKTSGRHTAKAPSASRRSPG